MGVVFSASFGRGMGGLLHPVRHKNFASGALGVFNASFGRGMVYLPLTARNDNGNDDDEPAPAPEPIPREKPKNHKISVIGVLSSLLGVFSVSLGRGMVFLLHLAHNDSSFTDTQRVSILLGNPPPPSSKNTRRGGCRSV